MHDQGKSEALDDSHHLISMEHLSLKTWLQRGVFMVSLFRRNEEQQKMVEKFMNRFIGCEAIYREKWIIAHVKLQRIEFRDRIRQEDQFEILERGISVVLEVIPEQGLDEGSPMKNIYADWQQLTFDMWKWDGGYAGWQIYFHPDVIQTVISIAESFKDGNYDNYGKLIECLSPVKESQD